VITVYLDHRQESYERKLTHIRSMKRVLDPTGQKDWGQTFCGRKKGSGSRKKE